MPVVLHRIEHQEPWYQRLWRPVACGVYLLICLTDFFIMPIYYEYRNAQAKTDYIVQEALKFDGGAAQVQALQLLRESRSWQPITLQQSGLFHIAFGAILGAASWKRGEERVARISSVEQLSNLIEQSTTDTKGGGNGQTTS